MCLKLATILLAATCFANAQILSISGKVSDANGVVPGVTVTIAVPAGTRQTTTGPEGSYRFDGLATGSYRLTFSRDGFGTATRTLTVLTDSAVLDVTLELSSVTTTIEVTDVAGKATSSRMEVADRDLPVQVSVVSHETLQEQGINDLATALQNVSGMSSQRQYGIYEYYTVRGFRGADVVLVDGMRLEGNRINSQTYNVEEVNVLKGPSSILYGAQSLGGAINLVRKKPEGTRGYDLQYRTGRFGLNQVAGGATGQIFNWSRLLYRVDVSFEDTNGWRGAGGQRLSVAPTLTWLINDRNRINFYEGFSRDNFDGDGGIPVGLYNTAGFDFNRRFNTNYDFARGRDWQNQISFNSSLSNRIEFRDSFLYRYQNDQYHVAESLTYQPAQNQVARSFLYFMHHRRPKQNMADILARFDFLGMHHSILVGYEYQDYFNYSHRSTAQSIAIPPISLSNYIDTYVPNLDFPISSIDYMTILTNAAYWQDQISLTKRIKVNVGGRFDDYRRAAHTDPWSGGVATSRGPDTNRHQDAYTYRAGVVYSLTESQQAYFSSSSSFQPLTTIPADGHELKPETGRSFEIGHRWQGLGNRFNMSTALYEMKRQNVAISYPGGIVEQAGQQSSKGVEFDMNGNIGHGVRLVANYGYTLPRFDNFFASNGTVNLTGFRPSLTTKHAANVWLTKFWKTGWSSSIGSRYMGQVFLDNNNTVPIGGWTTFRGSVGYRLRNWDWTVNAENLLNRQRYVIANLGNTQLYPGPPINVFATVRVHFR